MSFKTNQRTFQYLLATIYSRPSTCGYDDDGWTLQEVMRDFLDGQADKPLFLEQKRPRQFVSLVDHKETEHGLTLLISVADKTIPDPSQQDLDTRSIRSIPRKSGSAWAYSAHIFFSYKKQKTGEFRVLLETVPRVGRSTIQAFLNVALKRDSEWDHDGEDMYPQISFKGLLSEELKDALSEGAFQGVELQQFKPKDNMGVGKTGLRLERKTLSVRMPRKQKERRAYTGERIFNVLNDIKDMARKQDFDSMRILINNTDTNLPSSVQFDTSVDDVRDALFIKRRRRTFKTELKSAHSEIVEEIYRHGTLALRGE